MTGVRDVMLGWLVSRATAAGRPHIPGSHTVVDINPNYVWVSPQPRAALDALAAWMERSGLLEMEFGGRPFVTKISASQMTLLNGARLVFTNDRRLGRQHLEPTIDVVLEDAHDLKGCSQWLAEHVHGQVRWFGLRDAEYAETLARYGRDAMKISIDDALAGSWVNRMRYDRVRDTTDETFFRRYYQLRTSEHDETLDMPDRAFNRHRVWIRTDKPLSELSEEQQEKAREIEPDTHTALVPLVATPLQKLYLAHKRRARMLAKKKGQPLRIILLKYRRGGFTTLEQAASYRICASKRRANVATIAHDWDGTKQIFEIAHGIHGNDPKAPKLRGESKTHIEFDGTRSKFFIGSAGKRGFSRGTTLQRCHCSEVAFWKPGPNNEHEVDKLMSAITAAASHGEVVLESTPNGVEWFCKTYRAAKKGENNWYPIFLPWFVDPLNRLPAGTYDPEEIRDTMRADEKKLIERVRTQYDIELDESQIAWRRAQEKEHGRLFRQEYPEDDESCFITEGSMFFDCEVLRDMAEALQGRKRYREKHLPGGYMRWIEPPKPGVKYVAGTDTSEGLANSDPNGTGVMRKDNGKMVAWIHGRFRPAKLAEYSLQLVHWYNDALWGIERNNHGHAVLEALKNLCKEKYREGMEENARREKEHEQKKLAGKTVADEPELVSLQYLRRYQLPQWKGGRLYHYLPLDKQKPKDAKKAARPGWDTNPASRDRMLENFYTYVSGEDAEGGVLDPDFVSEAFTFKLQPSGKFEADPGSNDDAVMKWAIANQMRKARIAVVKMF